MRKTNKTREMIFMINFSEEDYRKLIDTLEVKSQSKEFNATIIKSLKTIKNLVDFRKELDNMRKSYDYFVVNTLENYGVEVSGIYKEFDKAWNEFYEKYKINDIKKGALTGVIAWATGGVGLTGQRVVKVKMFWKDYKNELKKIAREYAERKLNSEE
uniref:Uncharacterized protein n=1 Tax=uncultured organism TaxID=155900 RepID=M1PUT8_9ZZZZ|nr:hypothetical protein FLSS-3_0010 [uncultured organism]